jgi:hypothetical protein
MKGIYLTEEGLTELAKAIYVLQSSIANAESQIKEFKEMGFDVRQNEESIRSDKKVFAVYKEIASSYKPFLKQGSALSFHDYSEKRLVDAFHILFGRNYKKAWTETDKANEMRSIIKGNTQPCVSFDNWVAVVKFLI